MKHPAAGNGDEPRRMPAPWRVEQIPGGFRVADADGKALAYVYATDLQSEIDRGASLTWDEARRVAANIARLPDLLAARGLSSVT